MDLRQYVGVLRSHWLLIIAFIAVCTGAAAALAWTRTPIYSTRTELFIGTGQGSSLSQTYQGALFSQQRVLSYAPIVSSPYVVERVIAELHLKARVSDIQHEIQATVPAGTVLIDITVRDRSALRAQRLANATATQFAGFVTRLETVQSLQTSPVRVRVASPAFRPASPVSPRKRLELTLGVLLGAILGVGAAAMLEALKPNPAYAPPPSEA